MAARHRKILKQLRATAPREVPCGECGKPTQLVTGAEVYPHRPDLHRKRFWRCTCGAKIGCHDGTTHPLGTPAGPETQAARRAAHAAFDPLWKRKMERDGLPKHEARGAAYRWLADQLGLDGAQTHIGMFDAATARRVVAICEPFNARRPVEA